MRGDDDRWVLELDRLEQDLAEIEDALERGVAPVAPRAFETPGLSTPIPDALRPRAALLLERSRRAESAVASSLARVRSMMAEPDAERPARLFDTAL